MPKTTAEPSPSSNLSPPTRITASALPAPTYIPQDPTKKTHARKQPAGHVPRPRNAFILFRCDFVRQGKVPVDVENDHRNISRIAGRVWREMSAKEREPWVQMAEEEKRIHGRVHPGYRYTPHMVQPQGRKKKIGEEGAMRMGMKKGAEARAVRGLSPSPDLPEPKPSPPRGEDERTKVIQRLAYLPLPTPPTQEQHFMKAQMARPKPTKPYEYRNEYLQSWEPDVVPHIYESSPPISISSHNTDVNTPSPTTSSFLSLRRPSSCPPGAQRVSSAQLTHPLATSALQITRDDLARRPSRIPMYQSSPTALIFPIPGPGSGTGTGSGDRDRENSLGLEYPCASESPYVRDLGKNTRPPLLNGPYRIDPPRDAPGWDAPPPQAYPWIWGWGAEGRTTFNYLDLPHHVYGEVTKIDLEGISRAGLEGISSADVNMLCAQDSGAASPSPQLPVFTNPFAPVHTLIASSFNTAGSYNSAGETPSPSLTIQDPDNLDLGFGGAPFGAGGGDTTTHADVGLVPLGDEEFGELASRHFLAPEEVLIGQMFPRMSLDDRAYDQLNIGGADVRNGQREHGL